MSDAAISGQLSASDVDDAASLSFSVTGGADLPAGFTLESDGSYSFNPADDATSQWMRAILRC